MKKKPKPQKPRAVKVEEPQGEYSVQKSASEFGVPADKTIRYADPKSVQKFTKKILGEHRELFRRLAE